MKAYISALVILAVAFGSLALADATGELIELTREPATWNFVSIIN